MKKIVLALIILSSLVFGSVNEYKSDVYFANGVNTPRPLADQVAKILSLKFKTFSPKSYKSVAEWKVSYNHTHGIGIDLYESMLQKIDIDYCFDCIVATNE